MTMFFLHFHSYGNSPSKEESPSLLSQRHLERCQIGFHQFQSLGFLLLDSFVLFTELKLKKFQSFPLRDKQRRTVIDFMVLSKQTSQSVRENRSIQIIAFIEIF